MDIFGKLERLIANALMTLMGVVLIASVAELAYEIVIGLVRPPGLFLDVTELIDTFGTFLMVVIGLELMATMQMYLYEHKIHVEMMLMVAVTAVARKVVVLDTLKVEPLLILGVASLILALSGGYYLVRKK